MRIEHNLIKDDQGRALILRGCNLGGSSKMPFSPPGESWRKGSLANPAAASFVGRPFPLDEAELHFKRFEDWGFTVIRLVITWEALEHAGPGIYDEDYIDYLHALLCAAKRHGIAVYIDPHQDAWSRWTGGDGAPAWTMERLGINIELLDEAGAALTEQNYPGPLPTMIWPTNNYRYAAATMFTLFFAGRRFAPKTAIEGLNAQDYLQERYIACFKHCFARLKDTGAIAGWGAMNEPQPGFAGCPDAGARMEYLGAKGPFPTPFEGMMAASGHPVTVGVYQVGTGGPRVKGYQTINPRGLSLFRQGYSCPWKAAGVWTDEGGEGRLLQKDYFYEEGKDFISAYLKPFINRFIAEMRDCDKKAFLFIEGVPMTEHPEWDADDSPNAVHAFHWYDGFTLFMKNFYPWFSFNTGTGKPLLGRKRISAYFSAVLGEAVGWTRARMNNIPCFLGEFGLPFDMNGRKAYKSGGKLEKRYRLHEMALDFYYNAIDDNLLHATIWNYTADNTHERGDGWNGEDLSIFCAEDHGEKGRAAGGWLRPYPIATAGTPLSIRWERKKRVFSYRFKPEDCGGAPTVIFAPEECFGEKKYIGILDESGACVGEKIVENGRQVLVYTKKDCYNLKEVALIIKGR
jgi:hypothetical protein